MNSYICILGDETNQKCCISVAYNVSYGNFLEKGPVQYWSKYKSGYLFEEQFGNDIENKCVKLLKCCK